MIERNRSQALTQSEGLGNADNTMLILISSDFTYVRIHADHFSFRRNPTPS